MLMEFFSKKKSNYILLALILFFLVYSYQFFDIDLITSIVQRSQNNINTAGIYMAFIIFLLRSISIVVPIIPGTYCAVISGYIYGIEKGLIIMFISDFISCSISFLISRNLGRNFVRKILGQNQMKRVESISSNYLENNLFLMTGFLMTSWFDFVCYAVGLTKISWKKFMPALILSILISDLPFVAGGFALSKLKDVSLVQVLNGDVKVIEGPYLLVLVFSALIVFGLGFMNVFLKSKSKDQSL